MHRFTSQDHGRSSGVALAVLAVFGSVILACATEPTAPVSAKIGDVVLAKPVNCNVSVNLAITFRDEAGDGVISDAGGAYVEGVSGVGAHLSGVNGNLMLSVRESTRRIGYSTTASTGGSGLSDNRLFTNSHTNPGGNNACGLDGMVVASTGSAAVGFELAQGNRRDIIHYGKLCNGSADASTRVTTTHADANTWTISGTSGRHCRATGQGNSYGQVGTAGPFQMTLVRQ